MPYGRQEPSPQLPAIGHTGLPPWYLHFRGCKTPHETQTLRAGHRAETQDHGASSAPARGQKPPWDEGKHQGLLKAAVAELEPTSGYSPQHRLIPKSWGEQGGKGILQPPRPTTCHIAGHGLCACFTRICTPLAFLVEGTSAFWHYLTVYITGVVMAMIYARISHCSTWQ